MHLILILLGTSAIAWVLRETDYIVPVTAFLVIMLLAFAVNPGVAVFMLLAIAGIILLSLLVAFLPQVLGFILGALLIVVCIILAGSAIAQEKLVTSEQAMDRDSCGEIISDLAEYDYYSKGWKDIVPSEWGKDIRIYLYKKDREVEMTCRGGRMRMEERPHQIKLHGEVDTLK